MEMCDDEVFKNGEHVFLTHSLSSEVIEGWVKAIAKDCGQKVDWHWAGGRASILTLGDPKKTRASIKKLRETHDIAMWSRMKESSIPHSEPEIQRVITGIWEYNGFPAS
jgi:hypothetical protein